MLKNTLGLEFTKTGENTYEYVSDTYSDNKITYVPGQLLRIQGTCCILEYKDKQGRFLNKNGEVVHEFEISCVPDELEYVDWYTTGFYTSVMGEDY